MPKIAPRAEITQHPLYQATMAAQQVAYQLMRDVPADRKAEAARLHGLCVHATTFATAALDPDAERPAESYRQLAGVAASARQRIEPLAQYASDGKDVETLAETLVGIERDALAAAAAA